MKKDYEFPFLQVDKKNIFNPELFFRSLNLPKRSFPAQFSMRTKNYFCGGYFICYNQKITKDIIAQTCQARNWQFLANLIGDFFVVYCDFVKKELFVFTGQSSAFPCYFSLNKDKLVLSPGFSFVSNNIREKTLSVGSALDFIYGQHLGQRTCKTFIAEIKQIPPGSLLTINGDFSYSIENLIDFSGFYSQKPQIYKSRERFNEDFLSLLSIVINEQLAAMGKARFAAELSSGFDSSLVCYLLKKESEKQFTCYSSIAPAIEEFDSKHTIQEFSGKHGLKNTFLDVSDFYSFATKHDILWTKGYFFPADHGQEQVYKTWSKYRKDGASLIFTGFGGDELYGVGAEAEIIQFTLQHEFFNLVRAFKCSNKRLLTNKGTKLLLDRECFANKDFFSSIIPTSSTSPALFYFPVYWKLNCWQVTPFIDPRILKLALSIPKENGKVLTRRELFNHRSDIFVTSQFQDKIGGTSYVSQFLEKRKKLTLSILSTSILGKAGWIKSSEIINDLQGVNIKYYIKNANLLAQLHNLLRLEYFIQQNNIKVLDHL